MSTWYFTVSRYKAVVGQSVQLLSQLTVFTIHYV